MTLLNGLLPVIDESSSTRPLSTMIEPSKLSDFLKEQARIERLSSCLKNSIQSNQLYLEPPTHELFEIFKDFEGDEEMEDVTTDALNAPQLKFIGDLDMMVDSDDNTVATPPVLPDIVLYLKEYQERRKQMPSLEDLLKEPAVTDSHEVSQPEQRASEPIVSEQPQVQQPQIQQPQAEQPQVQQQQLQVQPPQVQQPQAQPPQVEQPQVKQPQVQQQPQIQQPQQTSSTESNSRPDADSSLNKWYAGDVLDAGSSTPKGAPIYAYPDSIVPIFCTPGQIQETDEITHDSREQATMFFNTNFDRALKVLNFPTSMIDMDLKDQWLQSGKACMLYHFLRALSSYNLCIAIITKDMDDEATLYELIRNGLKMTGIRINQVLDEEWDGEYGMLVSTKPMSTQQEFSRTADLILCLDVRIARKKDVFQKLNGRRQDSHPPVVWMLAQGSLEVNAYELLKSHDFLSVIFKSEAFRSLFSKDNDWPALDDIGFEAANTIVATNLASWLTDTTAAKPERYQFRSLQKLPQSFELGYLPQKQVERPTESAEDELEDMDISSDSEMGDDADNSTLEAYLSDDLLPLYELRLVEQKPSKELPRRDELISDNGKVVLNNLVEEYNKQVESLRRQYEEALSKMHDVYKEKAKSTITEIKKQ